MEAPEHRFQPSINLLSIAKSVKRWSQNRFLVYVSLKKHSKKVISRNQKPKQALPIYDFARFCPVLPGLARPCPALRRHGVGSKLYSPHAPTSQSATRPLGRQLAYRTPDSNLSRFSQHCMQIACNYRGFLILRGGTKSAFLEFDNPSMKKPRFS